ncbi:hypothetical protein [Myroides injenensis]|uniref:hypothetical protein n=1 Tax=Myroides injenensis TaxID=1183151 RepID=UPI00028A07DB|nr:hypothetical protein [Myroides injenensis]
MSNIENQNLRDTTYVNGDPYTNPTISILQEVYKLEKYEFDKIINGKSYLSEAKNLLIGICLALFINMFAKFIGNKIDPKIAFDNWEVYAFLISLGFLILIGICDYFFPSKRKKIIKVIKSHFNI